MKRLIRSRNIDLGAAFSTLPSGYSQVLSSYAGGEGALAFSYMGGGRGGRGGHQRSGRHREERAHSGDVD